MVKIRKATSKDFDTLCLFLDEIDDFEATLTPILSNSEEQRKTIRKEIRQNLRNPKKRVLIAEAEGKAAGTITAEYRSEVRPKFTRRSIGVLDHLFVLEQFRKQGIACALVEAAKSWLRRKSVTWFESYLCVNNTASLNTFKKSGFEPYAYIMHCYE